MKEKLDISVLDGKVKILQPEKGFKVCTDSIMLAAACPAKKGDRVLDAGCGVGTVGLCVNERVGGVDLVGVDVQNLSVDMAKKNVVLNEIEAEIILSDIRDYKVDSKDRFDFIVCNPPYMESGMHKASPVEHKAISNGHIYGDIELLDWVKSSLSLLKSGGMLVMVHRADVVHRLIEYLNKSFGAIELISLWPKEGKEAKRVIVRAIKDRKTPIKIHYGLVLHDSDGTYTDQAEKILREGEGLYV